MSPEIDEGLKMFKNKKIMIILLTLPFFLIVLLTFYFSGLRKYGTPSEYRAGLIEMREAREDSLRALQTMEPPENVADSTLFGMSMYSNVIERTKEKEEELKAIQTAIDSLKLLMATLEEKERSIEEKQRELQTGRELLQDENAQKMAKLYDSMKTQMATPLFIEMNDTLAVKIISRMQERTAARLLGAIAEQDVNKAARLNKILSMNEVAE